MEVSKYNAYKVKFGAAKKDDYRGKIMLQNVSKRISNNTQASKLLVRLEVVIQAWLDATSNLLKNFNYLVDQDDRDTII